MNAAPCDHAQSVGATPAPVRCTEVLRRIFEVVGGELMPDGKLIHCGVLSVFLDQMTESGFSNPSAPSIADLLNSSTTAVKRAIHELRAWRALVPLDADTAAARRISVTYSFGSMLLEPPSAISTICRHKRKVHAARKRAEKGSRPDLREARAIVVISNASKHVRREFMVTNDHDLATLVPHKTVVQARRALKGKGGWVNAERKDPASMTDIWSRVLDLDT